VDLQLAGRTALVTGSSSGIGEATARFLAREGAQVVVHGRDAARTDAVADEIRASGGKAAAVTGDLIEQAELEQAVAKIEQAVGGVDILVNNAGGRVGGWSRTGWHGVSRENWLATYKLNVVATAMLIDRLVPGMKTRGWGRTIQISSCVAIQQPPHFADYQAAKAAEMNMSRSLAHALSGSGVTSNCVSAGIILTPGSENEIAGIAREVGIGEDWRPHEAKLALEILRQSVGRIGRPDDVAAAVAFLASPHADFITGVNLLVEGGM